MKNIIFIFGLFFATTAFSQKSMQDKRKEVEAAKIAYITKAIDLKPEQAELFWPVYNEYSDKRRELKYKKNSLRDKLSDKSLSDAELEATFDKIIEVKEQTIQLDKATKIKMLHIISVRQFVALYEAEREFIRLIIRKARENGYNDD